MYRVKTRNWHCKKWVKFFLDISRLWGVKRADYYDDGDGKYILETDFMTFALLTWVYFMLLYPYSGGWTYIWHDGQYIYNSDPDYP